MGILLVTIILINYSIQTMMWIDNIKIKQGQKKTQLTTMPNSKGQE